MAKFNGGFPGGMPGNMSQLMKQAQKMQEEMKKKQEELEEKVYEATAAGGAIKVTMTGKKEIQELIIDKEIVDPEDVDTLELSIKAAMNEVIRKVTEQEESVYGSVTNNIKLPF